MTDKRPHPLEKSDQRKSSDSARAAARLARVLDPSIPLPQAAVIPERAPELVEFLGVQFDFQPQPVTIDPTDPLLVQARVGLEASSVRTRDLTLIPGWWDTNVPPMVVLHRGRLAAVLPSALFAPVLHQVGSEPRAVTSEVAAEIDTAAVEVIRPLPNRSVGIGELMRYGLFGTRRDLTIALLASIAVGAITLAVPIATSMVFGDVVPTGNVTRLAAVIATLLVLSIASAAFAYTCTYHLIRIFDAVEISTSGAVLDRVLRLPASALRRWSSAELSARILVASSINAALSQGITLGVMSIVMSLLNGVLLIVLIPSLGLVAVVIGVLLVGAKLLFMRVENRRRVRELAMQDVLDDTTLGILRGWVPLRLTDGEVAAFGRWAEAFANYRVAFNSRWGADIASAVVTSGALSVAIVLFVLLGYLLPVGSMSAGAFLAFVSAFGQFSAGITGVILTLGAFTRIKPEIDRLGPLMSIAPEREATRENPGELRGHIDVRRLSFRYGEDQPWVLRDVTFSAPAGSFIGVVGTSGSGKSTLLRLLLGFESPHGGVVMYDGSDLSSLDVGAVRRQCGVVLQSSLLLPGSIRENVTVSSGPIPDSEIWELLARVSVDEAIRAMPRGLDTMVDEGSTILSGGQRQRILLARALAHAPAVLFLDEATSALDNVTQEAVTRNVATLGVTRVVIAHRLSTIRQADHIVVLHEGTVAEQGNYEQLVAQQGLFASLVERQEL